MPTAAGYALVALGNILVISSTWQLGITGTFLGDYFGIVMDSMVTGFPFNITNAPMYYGSTMSFLGTALIFGKPAGIFLTGVVFMLFWRIKDGRYWQERASLPDPDVVHGLKAGAADPDGLEG